MTKLELFLFCLAGSYPEGQYTAEARQPERSTGGLPDSGEDCSVMLALGRLREIVLCVQVSCWQFERNKKSKQASIEIKPKGEDKLSFFFFLDCILFG